MDNKHLRSSSRERAKNMNSTRQKSINQNTDSSQIQIYFSKDDGRGDSSECESFDNDLGQQSYENNNVTTVSTLYELSSNAEKSELSLIKLPRKKVIHFASNDTHNIVITSDNMVYGWGEDNYGQLGLGDTNKYREYPICINYLTSKQVIKSSLGCGFSLFLSKQGIVYSCGYSGYGTLGHNYWNCISMPTIIKQLLTKHIVDIACGNHHAVAMSHNGKIFTWGGSQYGQLGQGGTYCRCIPIEVSLPGVYSIYTGPFATAVITSNNKLLVCGNNQYNQLGITNQECIRTFTPVTTISGTRIRYISLGKNHTIILLKSGDVICMGRNSEGQLGKGNYNEYLSPQFIKIGPKIRTAECGELYTVVSDGRDRIWLWGEYSKQNYSRNDSCDKENQNENCKRNQQFYSLARFSLVNKSNSNSFTISKVLPKTDKLLVLVHN